MSEIEIKFKVENFPTEKIEYLGFIKKKESHQVDFYQIVNKIIDGRRTYMRTRKDISKKEYSWDLHQIESEFSTNEIETSLTDEKSFVDTNTRLSIIGFPIVCEIDKQRTVFEKSNIKILLDSVKHLGKYVEIEIMGKDTQENRDILFNIANELSLDNESRVSKKGYPDLFLEKYKNLTII